MYRHTRKRERQLAICARMRAGKERRRDDRAKELGHRPEIYTPPELRRVVIVIDFDMKPTVDVFRLKRTNRITTYSVEHNGHASDAMGWSNFCKRLSGHYPALLSPYSE
jgi:hypothetical protein